MTRATARSGRRPGWLGLAVCLVVVAALALLVPDPATDVRQQWDDVAVGEVGTLRMFDAEVTRVRTTTAVAADADRDPLISGAVLVVVDLRLTVRDRPALFSNLTLLSADGRTYQPRPEFITAAPTQTQPGFTRTASLVFELPPDRVAGSRLLVEPDSTAFVGYDRAVRVDLGLTPGADVDPAVVVLDEPRLAAT